MVRRLTAEETALFTAYLIHTYEEEKGKKTSRCRLSRRTVRLLSLRTNLRDAFIKDWIDALASDWGWLAFEFGEEFALIRSKSVEDWTRLSSKRVSDTRKSLAQGNLMTLDMMFRVLSQEVPDDEDEAE
ncbi:MAG: hypothetical protein K2X11_11310 [Acetobacteraceae bacterium]|nr:hypothetical protein [Acetobacteraceae bacterium]